MSNTPFPLLRERLHALACRCLAGNGNSRLSSRHALMDRQPMFDTARNLLLALLLMLGQAGLVLHQVDFDQHADSGACLVCLAAPGLDQAIPAHFTPLLPAPAAALAVAAVTASPVFPAPAFRLARAPPALTP
jgi:hypothetical protein